MLWSSAPLANMMQFLQLGCTHQVDTYIQGERVPWFVALRPI